MFNFSDSHSAAFHNSRTPCTSPCREQPGTATAATTTEATATAATTTTDAATTTEATAATIKTV
jgi:hypothetical protein